MRVRKKLAVATTSVLIFAGMHSSGAVPESKEVFIIKYVDSVNLDNEIAALKAGGSEIQFEYRNVFKGVLASMPPQAAAALTRNPKIQIVERDSVVTTQQDLSTEPDLWGLDRIDQTNLPLDTNYNFASQGLGVTAYVVDTGIDITHSEITPRAKWGINYAGGKNVDCNGHGTHVAGTIGAKTYGVAKSVSLVAVKVLDCRGSGFTSNIIKGLEWIKKQSARPAVVNMSLGGGLSPTLNNAVTSLTQAGIVVVVAAGNSNLDACGTSPASATSAITVGATSRTDSRASFSNWGTCLDLFAPGVAIKSIIPGGKTAVYNGTSMASPHVAGVVARYLGANPGSAVSTVTSALLTDATNDKVGDPKGSPNELLFRSQGS